MSGQSSKNKNNLEKIKREMSMKKQKADSQKREVDLIVEIETAELKHTMEFENQIGMASDTILEAGLITGNKGDDINTIIESDVKVMIDDDPKNIKWTVENKKKIEMVVFRVGEEEFAFVLSNVNEIIRIPSMSKVPNAPEYISGLCSLRGELLPVVDSRRLFGMPEQEFSETSRIIVADICGKKIGLVSDKVSEVINVEEESVLDPPESIRRFDGGFINGILILNDGKRVVMVLDATKINNVMKLDLLESQQTYNLGKIMDTEVNKHEEEQIVIFNIGIEEYAFDINYVKEIIRMPNIMKIPNTARHIEGVFSIRNQILAVINPGKLLGINCKDPDEYSRVVVINNGSISYGVIVDKVSHVLRVQKELLKESEQIACCSSAEYVKGIYNLNNGNRLVMMLEAHKLIDSGDLKGVVALDNINKENDQSLLTTDTINKLEHIVVFRLGEEEYGIDINNVQEINRMTEITHFPGAPRFIAGMVYLRGDIIPIMDPRKLFNVNDSESFGASKFLVVELGNKRIGILIDSVSEVLRFSKTYLEEAADVFNGHQDNYIDKIAKLNNGERIIMILKLSSLLSFI